MTGVLKIVKESLPLSIFAIGVALAGYTALSKKVDHVAKKSINTVDKLEISESKITAGQGEYIVFHLLEDGERRQVSKETFEKVYEALTYYAPTSIIKRRSPKAEEECSKRYQLTRKKVQQIDPSLEIAFVPRTLYDLIFIRKCIEEDVKHNNICPYSHYQRHKMKPEFFEDQQHYEAFLVKKSVIQEVRRCWHLCYFEHVEDHTHPHLSKIAYLLNRAAVKTLSPSIKGFTHEQLSYHAEKEIEFLKAHYIKGLGEMQKKKNQEKSLFTCDPGVNLKLTLTYNFGFNGVQSLAITNDANAQIVRNALTLECSEMALKKLFIYRGADLEKDLPFSIADNPYSLSYGSSLFAGCVYDPGATAFNYMRYKENAYAIPIPFEQLEESPFFVPTPGVGQNYGNGEAFHARTKSWKDADLENIQGMCGVAGGHEREHLKSNLSRTQLIAQFNRFKQQSIQLK